MYCYFDLPHPFSQKLIIYSYKFTSAGILDYEWDYFERSVPMSSYLVAMIIADYSYVESDTSDNNITFRVWARHSAINQTKYV